MNKLDMDELDVCMSDDVCVHVTYLYMLDTGEMDMN